MTINIFNFGKGRSRQDISDVVDRFIADKPVFSSLCLFISTLLK